ncbi:DUF3828 domain-containing protein [Dongia sp.]|uniref:DUF3828 domain-containing protein n=1 Tax=Dongia sp. TaxID=1977262 RepID=UPI0035B12BC7
MLNGLLRSLFLAAGLIIAGCAAPGPQALAEGGFASPQDLLNELYGHYADKPAGSGVDLGDPAMVTKYFAPDLAAKIDADFKQAAAANEIPALDGDPFVGAQDWQVTDLAIAVAKSAEPDKTMAVVKFKNYDELKELKLSLARTDAGWQIVDIDWGYDKLSKIYGE